MINTYIVYFKIFGAGKKITISKEDINSQKEAEDYVLKNVIPENTYFYDFEKIKEKKKSSPEIDEIGELFEGFSKNLDKVFGKAGKIIDDVFDSLDENIGKTFDKKK